MKKLFSSTLAILFAVVAFAQSANLYKFTNEQEAQYLLKAISLELKLTQEEFSKVSEIIMGSARSQMEQYQNELAKDPQHVEMIVSRQTRHIESNIEQILGTEKYQQFVAAKPAISKKAVELGRK